MTEQEALAELKSFPVNCLDFKEQMALDMAIEAMKKQIAKKPVGLKKNICPNCSWGIIMTTQKYCDECGKKLVR